MSANLRLQCGFCSTRASGCCEDCCVQLCTRHRHNNICPECRVPAGSACSVCKADTPCGSECSECRIPLCASCTYSCECPIHTRHNYCGSCKPTCWRCDYCHRPQPDTIQPKICEDCHDKVCRKCLIRYERRTGLPKDGVLTFHIKQSCYECYDFARIN